MSARVVHLLIALLLASPCAVGSADNPVDVRVGVLALRGEAHAIDRWQPTIDYLSEQLGDVHVHLVPLDFEQVEPFVKAGDVDFLLANSAFYVLVENRYGASRIATLRNQSSKGGQTHFSSAVIRLAARTDLAELEDLKGARVGAVDSRSLGGFLMIAGAMREQGLDLLTDPAGLSWLHTHDAVVQAVLAGEIDAGVVRSDTVERMAAEGRIVQSALDIVAPVTGDRFPFMHSTRLYPEWPMAVLQHVDHALRDRVALLLLQMPSDHPAATRGRYLGWAIPHNYQAVHALLRQMRQAPYESRATLRELLWSNLHWLITGLAIVLLTTLYIALLRHRNRTLAQARAALSRSVDAEKRTLVELQQVTRDRNSIEAQFSRLAEKSRDGIVLMNQSGAVVYINEAAATILGYDKEELHGRSFHQLVVPDGLQEPAEAGMARFRQSGEGPVLDRQMEISAKRKDGQSVSLELSVGALMEDGAKLAIGIFRDVTERQKILRALEETTENFQNIVKKNRSGILLTDIDGTIVFSNEAAEKMLGLDPSKVPGARFGVPAKLDIRMEMSILRADGKLGTAETFFTQTEWRGRPAYLVMLHDVSFYREAQEEINDLALKDSLTRLANRHQLMQQLRYAVQRHTRSKTRFALLFLDLNNFKEVNDTLGHFVGDQLLVEVARRLSQGLRSSDFVARMGADEFTVVLEGIDDDSFTREVANKLGELIAVPVMIGESELHISASIGSSCFPDGAKSADELLQQADTAMHRAERMGVGYLAYAPDMGDMVARSAQLVRELHRAIQEKQFAMYYQVQVDLSTELPVAYEALIRWNKGQDVVSPGEFIPVLENSGMIVEVGRWVIDEVCRQLRTWLDDEQHYTLPVAVNLSPLQLERDELSPYICGLLSRYDIPPRLFVVEITEGALLASSSRVLSQLNELRAFGVEMHLDDFGTGYSALSMLKRFPFSVIKIDRAFIRDLENDEADIGLTRATIAMSEGLGMKALAEGIETPQQLEILRELGCHYGQGYLFGRPVDAAAVQRGARTRRMG